MKIKSRSNYPSRLAKLINHLCDISHGTNELHTLQATSSRNPLRKAILRNDTEALFNWLINTFSYQGLSDSAVESFIAENGNASFSEIRNALSERACNKLDGFWKFEGCSYQKSQQKCSTPELLRTCPLPKLPLRNGRLNQLAFSLFFFIRDVAQEDLTKFLNVSILTIPIAASPQEVYEKLVPPWRSIFGVSDKVATMALSTLLMSAPREWDCWRRAGQQLIVIDSLVHNFLHRTGATREFGTIHPYGNGCYAPGGCFDVIGKLAEAVNARRFNFDFPSYFPRFVQLSIWKYCAQSAWDICNGNQINDKESCDVGGCYLRECCKRVSLAS